MKTKPLSDCYDLLTDAQKVVDALKAASALALMMHKPDVAAEFTRLAEVTRLSSFDCHKQVALWTLVAIEADDALREAREMKGHE